MKVLNKSMSIYLVKRKVKYCIWPIAIQKTRSNVSLGILDNTTNYKKISTSFNSGFTFLYLKLSQLFSTGFSKQVRHFQNNFIEIKSFHTHIFKRINYSAYKIERLTIDFEIYLLLVG